MNPKVSIEQWRMLQAVVDHGGYAQAAAALHKSQSSISYAVARLEDLLGIQVLEIKGRKAFLTSAGRILLERSRQLVNDAGELEQAASVLQQGWEAEIQLVFETALPRQVLLQTLSEFARINKDTRIRLKEVVLSGAEESLLSGEADIAISPFVPHGFLGEPLLEIEFIAVAHPDHALHQLKRDLGIRDINRETQIIISDSGSKSIDAGWLSDAHRWSVSSVESAIALIRSGLGFGWLPYYHIERDLDEGLLKPLRLNHGSSQAGTLYLIYAKQELAGPATQQLGQLFTTITEQFHLTYSR